jgi:hypothetical protein
MGSNRIVRLPARFVLPLIALAVASFGTSEDSIASPSAGDAKVTHDTHSDIGPLPPLVVPHVEPSPVYTWQRHPVWPLYDEFTRRFLVSDLQEGSDIVTASTVESVPDFSRLYPERREEIRELLVDILTDCVRLNDLCSPSRFTQLPTLSVVQFAHVGRAEDVHFADEIVRSPKLDPYYRLYLVKWMAEVSRQDYFDVLLRYMSRDVDARLRWHIAVQFRHLPVTASLARRKDLLRKINSEEQSPDVRHAIDIALWLAEHPYECLLEDSHGKELCVYICPRSGREGTRGIPCFQSIAKTNSHLKPFRMERKAPWRD